MSVFKLFSQLYDHNLSKNYKTYFKKANQNKAKHEELRLAFFASSSLLSGHA